jgi:hypothetical protein
MLGLTAATFATTDSALTALTTSFCVDFLGFDKKENENDPNVIKKRNIVHIGFSLLILIVILLFNALNDASVVSAIFKVATFTYGPLIGLYAFSLYAKKRDVWDNATPVICVISPMICFFLDKYSVNLLGGYVFAEELIIINGLITFAGLLLVSRKRNISNNK